MSKQTLWLDTDIGDDTDDILALALILTSHELDLAGISTVYGETRQRARLAQTILKINGRDTIPVSAGCGHPMMGTGIPEVMPNGPMKREPIAQAPCSWAASRLPALSPLHSVEHLSQTLQNHPGQITPVSIGPLTNIATLLIQAPETIRSIPRLIAMAGEFRHDMWEWNIRCDPLAAACVIESELPIDFIPWDIGRICTISQRQLNRLFDSNSPTGCLLTRAIKLWRQAKPDLHDMPHLFDPMAVAVLTHPHWFEWHRGKVTVDLTPQGLARTRFHPDSQGPHRIAWSVNKTAALRTVWSRILSL